ncbi:MAG TPA: HU family DNA-binding protein [Flavipsychrobacter sp.]|nr:HU family DNA-binding protein [Flavipsychrobacter sp.]
MESCNRQGFQAKKSDPAYLELLQTSLYLPHLNLFLQQKNKTNMNKAELIDKISKDADVTKTQANAAIDSFTDSIIATLKKGDRVTLVGFGTFSVSERAARNGRNPQTGEVIKIKARKVPKFKAGKEFSTKISSKK